MTYQDTESKPGVHHSYQTWQSFEQVQKQKRPSKGNKKRKSVSI